MLFFSFLVVSLVSGLLLSLAAREYNYCMQPWPSLPIASLHSQSWKPEPEPLGMDAASQAMGDIVEGDGSYVPNLHDTPSESWTEMMSQIDSQLPVIETSECCYQCVDICAFNQSFVRSLMYKLVNYCSACISILNIRIGKNNLHTCFLRRNGISKAPPRAAAWCNFAWNMISYGVIKWSQATALGRQFLYIINAEYT